MPPLSKKTIKFQRNMSLFDVTVADKEKKMTIYNMSAGGWSKLLLDAVELDLSHGHLNLQE